MSADHDRATVEVPVRRLRAWLAGFESRHGVWSAHAGEPPGRWELTAADGARALLVVPSWAVPMLGSAPSDGLDEGLFGLAPDFGVILLRRAGYGVARFAGSRQVAAKVGSRHIHGRTATGGWSQQRYARRRANQADEIAEAAARWAEELLIDAAGAPAVDFLVTGGDRPLLAAALERGPGPLRDLPVGVHLAVGTPNRQVLDGVADRVLAVSIDVSG